MKSNTAITYDHTICGGSPTIVGTRLTIHNVVTKCNVEPTRAAVYEDYGLTPEQVDEALIYCSELSCVGDMKRARFCSNCMLDELSRPLEPGSELATRLVETGDPSLIESLVPPATLDEDFARGWELARAERAAGRKE